MNDEQRAYTDRIFEESMKMATCGFSIEKATEANEKGLQLLERELGKALEADDTKPIKCPTCETKFSIPLNAVERSKALVNLSGMLDKLVRLTQFSGGKPDSRPEVKGNAMHANVLQGLKAHQFEQVCQWLEENERELQEQT